MRCRAATGVLRSSCAPTPSQGILFHNSKVLELARSSISYPAPDLTTMATRPGSRGGHPRPRHESPHARLLTLAAREMLAPLGCIQKGRSRTWLDDRGWFVTVIEFQPAGSSQGSYLNVGVHLLWNWSGHLSFDMIRRSEPFVRYMSDAQFGPEAARLASVAGAEVLSVRAGLREPSAVADVIQTRSDIAGWGAYHQAVSLALGGKGMAAQDLFRCMATPRAGEPAWLVELRQECSEFAELVAEPVAFRAKIERLIAAQRTALHLPAVQGSLPG